jgi:transposase
VICFPILRLSFLTTSIYFEGAGGETLGRLGHSKDHRPDLNQMIVGVVIDNNGNPICCEMWPGNIADVKSLIPVIERTRMRFRIMRFCVVADQGMISEETLAYLEQEKIPYILGARLRRVKEVKIDDPRYIVCLNERQARKDAADRQAIIDALQEKIRSNPKSLVGNKGFREYLSLDRDTVSINRQKIQDEERFDGKWVLRTNTKLTSEQVVLKYKQLWQVEHVFRDMKSILDTRPIFHKRDETIRGHVFCSFLALVLRKELDGRLEKAGHCFGGQTSSRISKRSRKLLLRIAEKPFRSGANAWESAARFFRLSALPFLQRFGKYHDANLICQRTTCGAKNFFV